MLCPSVNNIKTNRIFCEFSVNHSGGADAYSGMKQFIASLCISCIALTVAAEQAAKVATNAQPIVVTATRTQRQLLEVPASVSVITDEQIGAAAGRNVDDCLRQVQGVSIVQVMGMSQGMPSRINVRGVPGETRLLLLADGLPLNEAISRFISINEVPMDSIQQVEVIRGPFSSLYGTDAFSGVINIITKEYPEEPEIGISGGMGNSGYRNFAADTGGSSGPLKYRLDFERRSIDNYLARDYAIDRRYDYATEKYTDTRITPDNFDYVDTKVLGKLSLDMGPDTTLSLFGRYFQGDMGYGLKDLSPLYPTPVDNVTMTRTAIAGATLNTAWSSDLDIKIGGYYRRQTRALWGLDLFGMDGETPVYAQSYSETVCDEWQASCDGDLKIGSSHTLSAGFEIKRSTVDFVALQRLDNGTDFPGAAGSKNHLVDSGLFVQDEIKMTSKWKVIGGLRVDNNSEFGTALSPRASTLYAVSEQTTIRASVGRAFRAPSLVELYQPPLSFGYVTFVSNPDLKPEYVWSVDMEIEHHVSKALSGRIGVFYNDMDDLIANKASGDVLTNVNLDKARSAGVEAGIDLIMTSYATAFMTYTFVKAENKNTGGELEYIPKHTGSAGLRLNKSFNNWRIEGSLAETYAGTRGFQDWSSGSWYEFDEYFRTDIALKTTYRDGLWVKIGVQNVTDERYQESMMSPLAPGRLAVLEAGARY